MSINVNALLHHVHIPQAEPGSKKYKAGWVHIRCPRCSDGSTHCGAPEVGGGLFHCVRCKRKTTLLELLTITGKAANERDARALITRFETPGTRRRKLERVTAAFVQAPEMPRLPLSLRAQCYLTDHGFDPAQIIKDWGVFDGGPVGNMAHRLVIPIYDLQGDVIDYIGRDLTNRRDVERFKGTPGGPMTTHRWLYGLEAIQPATTCFIVEGPASVWRLGKGRAVATSGTAWTVEQLKLIVDRKLICIVMMDNDSAGNEAGKTLTRSLLGLGITAHEVYVNPTAENDNAIKPADMPQNQADQMRDWLVHQLNK